MSRTIKDHPRRSFQSRVRHRCPRGTCSWCDDNAIFAQYQADVIMMQDLRVLKDEDDYRDESVCRGNW